MMQHLSQTMIPAQGAAEDSQTPSGLRRAAVWQCLVVLLLAALVVGGIRIAHEWPSRVLSGEGPALGSSIPDAAFSTGVNAQPWHSGDAGNAVLMFFRDTCPYCRAVLPSAVAAFQARSGAQPQLILIHESNQASQEARRAGWTGPVYLDASNQMTGAFHLRHVPAFLWYQHGRLKAKFSGANGWLELREQLAASTPAPQISLPQRGVGETTSHPGAECECNGSAGNEPAK